MSLTRSQITKLKRMIADNTDAQVDKVQGCRLSVAEAEDCRERAKEAEDALTKYIDGLAIVPRKKGYGK